MRKFRDTGQKEKYHLPRWVLAICKYKNIATGGGRFGCDGEAALNKSFDQGWDVRYSDSHHDILQCIHMVRDQIPFRFQKHWISSHPEERGIPYWRLDLMSQMNYDCDLGAKARAQLPVPLDLPTNVQSQSWGILINGVRIISKIDATIRQHIHDPELLEYWHEKGRLRRTTHNKIDWPVLALAKKSTPRYLTIGITKLFSHNCATGVKMKLWGFRDNDHCPHCGAIPEGMCLTYWRVKRCPRKKHGPNPCNGSTSGWKNRKRRDRSDDT